MFHLGNNAVPEDIDEIQQFQQARWISPPEAMWRIYQLCLNEMYPSVKSLQVHLENMQHVGFREDTNLLSILHNQQASKTMLTEYFQMNQLDKDACRFVYKEFPEYYVWNEDKKYWSQRKQRNAIGRLTAASPVEGERYYLRLLLNHVNGATSYQSLQTVNGIKFDIFRKAAEQFGLHESDNNIDQCLEEASLFQMTFTLRRLFATLLVYCGVHNPAAVWDKYKDAMSKDFAKTNFMSARNTEAKALQSINYFLESIGKSIIEYALLAVMIVNSPDEKLLKEIHEELNIPISENELFTIENLNSEKKKSLYHHSRKIKKLQ
ncbi:hypothetical protein MRB53_016711 [Persea americana]|uniref:Uncharacterized protein n=1 Tax=Persea americana TaxID=3435 RepID=A0ACC2M2N1_PERAE|nr:hypothetical protein MRB53_016711 [Persea americana]